MHPTAQEAYSPSRTALRQLLLAQRLSLSAAQRRNASERLAGQLMAWLAQHTSLTDIVAVYLSHKGEPDILPWTGQFNRPLALPVVQERAQPLRFARWVAGDALQAGQYGIAIPKTLSFVEPDVIVLPCVGVMNNGAGAMYRMGYGGGYYDRTLAALRGVRTVQAIGVAYASSRCVFEVQTHDVPLDDCLLG